jgi:hypothetical protein
VLDSIQVQTLVQLVDESVRASREGVKHFVEPTPGVLAKAKSKRTTSYLGGGDQVNRACFKKFQLI